MAVLQPSDIADLVKMTQNDLGRLRFSEIASDLQRHVAMGSLLNSERVEFQSGKAIQWNVMTQESGAAKMTGLYEVDQVNVADVMQTASADWRHATTNYALERREIQMNMNPARIVDLTTIRRTDALISMAELLETQFWGDPADNGSDMFGVYYWIPRPDDGDEGFNDNNPTNFTGGAGGLDAASFTRWRSWGADYADITKTDLIRKWRKAATFTDFMSAVPVADYNPGDRFGYYTNYNVLGKMEEMLEAQNDSLGNDVASKDGSVLFRGTPVTWVPKLEDDTSNPVFGINWGVFRIAVLAGEFLREQGPIMAANQHTVMQVHVDLTANIICYDRRRNFILDVA